MLYLISIALIFLCSYILIFKNFKLSLYVLISLSVLLHKELFSFYRWDLMPIRIFMLALLCVGITKTYLFIVKNGGIKSLIPYLKDPFILVILLIWLTRGLSIIFSKNLQASLLLFGFFTTTVSLGVYLYLTFRESPLELFKYLRFFTYVVFVLTIFGYFQLYYFYQTQKVIGAMWPVPGKIPRVGSLFWDVNHYGASLSALIPVMVIFIFQDKGKKIRSLNILMFLSFVFSLLLTNSRTAWMLSGFSFLFFSTILLIKKFGKRGILYIFIAITLISAPFAIEYSDKKSAFRRYIRDAFHYRVDSFDSHFMLLTGTYQIFEKYPYLGGGYGSFFEHFSKTKIAPTFFTRDTAALSNRVPAHTIWGESLSETGILGTIPFLSFFLFAFLAPLYVFFTNKDKLLKLTGGVLSSVLFGWYLAGVFYSYNSEFFWILIFMYFIWGIGMIGKDWFKKIIEFFFTNDGIIFSIVLVLSSLLLFTGLGKNHLIPWDEAIYAKVAKNMVVRNEYIIPYWDNFLTGWFEKPPLYMWMMSGLMRVFGFNSWSARIPSAFFGFLTIALVYIIAKRFFNKTTAFISSLALMTTIQFLYYSRASMLDVTATFFITLSLYLYWEAKERKKIFLWILSGASTGLAVMTKGFVGLLPFLVIVLYEIYLFVVDKQKINKRFILNFVFMLMPFLIVALPWHLTMYKIFGKSFINKYFLYHVWDRATVAIEDKGNPFFWYIVVLKVSMRIWFVVLMAAFPFSLFQAIERNKKFVFLSIWAVSIFLFFSVAKSKLVWYVTPIYPVLVLMVGLFSERFLDFMMNRVRKFNSKTFKFLSIFLMLFLSLFYLFLNRKMVYTSDLNGSQAKLLMLKDKLFGTDNPVYIDRIEIPTPLFYTDGPFVATDVNVDDPDRIPRAPKNEPLIFLSRKGRFREQVSGYAKKSKVAGEDESWILWYIPPEEGEFLIERN